MTQTMGIVFRPGSLVANEVTHFRRRLSLHGPLAVTQAQSGQVGPGFGMTNAFGRMQDRVAAILLPPVPALPRLIGIVLDVGEIGVEGPGECCLNVIEEMLLVVLDREGIVPAL